jgi:ketosteroid isomerase-like protein
LPATFAASTDKGDSMNARAFLAGALLLAASAAEARLADLPPDLKAAAEAFERAQIAGDAAALDRLLAKDYRLTNGNGAIDSREQFIRDWAAPGFDPEPVTVREPVNLVWRDGAALGGLVTLRGKQDGKPFSVTLRYIDVWERTPQGWRVAYGQATRVKNP